MSTTSNFRADAAAVLFLVTAACTSTTASNVSNVSASVSEQIEAPDSPQPALPADDKRPPSAEPKYARIELASVRVRRLDAELAQLAGPAFLRSAPDPVAVEAITVSELPPPVGASSPVLIINGQVYPDTWYRRPRRLVAFLADRKSLRGTNTVEAEWTGTGGSTRSEKPLTFSGNE